MPACNVLALAHWRNGFCTQGVALTDSLRTIVLIDDDPAILGAMQMLLELEGCRVIPARGCEAGISAFTSAHRPQSPVSLVMTDLAMPDREGLDVARRIKALAPTVPVILLSGCIERLIPGEAEAEHVDLVLAKPPSRGVLRQTLKNLGSLRPPIST
jgi:CheY-like chemotaxis protein